LTFTGTSVRASLCLPSGSITAAFLLSLTDPKQDKGLFYMCPNTWSRASLVWLLHNTAA